MERQRREIIEWSLAKGLPWDEEVTKTAVIFGRLDLLMWFLAHGYLKGYPLEMLFAIMPKSMTVSRYCNGLNKLAWGAYQIEFLQSLQFVE